MHKNQGIMIPTKIVSEIINKEIEYRLSCIVMSYVKWFTDIGIKDSIEKIVYILRFANRNR